MPIVVVVDSMSIPLVPRMISTESTIVVVAMEFVAAFMVIISTMVIVPSVMTVSSVMTVVVMRGMLLERGLRMVLVDSKPPLPILCLLHAILQYDSLVHQGLVIGSVGNGQRDLKFIIETPEELGLPLDISINVIWSIMGQCLEVVHVLL